MVDNTFWMDFTIADAFGLDAIQDTFNRAFNEWKSDYKMLTALVMVLNNDLWEQAQYYALTNLKGDELQYYYEITD